MSEQKTWRAERTRTIGDAAQMYNELGFRLVRLKRDAKIPISKAWQNADPKPSEFSSADNIGVLLGPRSGGLIDIDLDSLEARELAGLHCFFGNLPSFGRRSSPVGALGHRLVICEDAPPSVEKFAFGRRAEVETISALGMKRNVVLELRCGRVQTAVPPSVLAGDRLVWGDEDIHLPTMSWTVLRQRAGWLAFAAVAAACYPGEGSRDNYCLSLAGALIWIGMDPVDAELVISTIARMNGDEEDRSGKAEATARKHTAGDPVTGLRTFLELAGLQTCDRTVRGWLGLQSPATVASDMPSDAIDVGNTDLVDRTGRIESLLIEKGVGIYRRGPELVRIRRLEALEGGRAMGTWRHEGLCELTPATAKWIAHQASAVGHFYKRSRGGSVKVAPSSDLMEELHVTVDQRRFPVILGISMTPTLTRSEPGYDPKSGLLLCFAPGAFPPLPDRPTRGDAEEALARLKHPLRGFPFVDHASRSVALSCMIFGVIRSDLSAVPLHAITSPTAGTGKTKLADIAGVIATGVPPSGIAYSPSAEENDKRLVSILRAGDPVILLDNVTGDLEGDTLCTALTQDTIQARILGATETIHLSTRSLVLATGNNLRVKGDLTRRTVVCRLDAMIPNLACCRFRGR